MLPNAADFPAKRRDETMANFYGNDGNNTGVADPNAYGGDGNDMLKGTAAPTSSTAGTTTIFSSASFPSVLPEPATAHTIPTRYDSEAASGDDLDGDNGSTPCTASTATT